MARSEERVESRIPGSTVTVFWLESRPSNLSMLSRLTVTLAGSPEAGNAPPTTLIVVPLSLACPITVRSSGTVEGSRTSLSFPPHNLASNRLNPATKFPHTDVFILVLIGLLGSEHFDALAASWLVTGQCHRIFVGPIR